jgi:hypothetical protein
MTPQLWIQKSAKIIQKLDEALNQQHPLTVLKTKDGAVSIEYNGKALIAVPYHQMQARTEEVSSKELLAVLVEKKQYTPRPGRYHPWKRGPRYSRRPSAFASCC